MKMLHTRIRVGELERSLAFYTRDDPEGKFALAFVGYGPEESNTVIELTHNWDTPKYDLGSGFQE